VLRRLFAKGLQLLPTTPARGNQGWAKVAPHNSSSSISVTKGLGNAHRQELTSCLRYLLAGGLLFHPAVFVARSETRIAVADMSLCGRLRQAENKFLLMQDSDALLLVRRRLFICRGRGGSRCLHGQRTRLRLLGVKTQRPRENKPSDYGDYEKVAFGCNY
jgi:hypothetical protein